MFKKLLIICSILTASCSLAQSWELAHDYPLELPGGVRYQQVPNSLVKVYLPKGTPTIEEVRNGKGLFKDSPDELELQNGTVVWAKLDVKNNESKATRFLLELDSYHWVWGTIDLYVIANDTVQKHIVTGNEIYPKLKPIRDRRNLVWLELEPQESYQLFIRYTSNSESHRSGLDVRILDRQSLQDFEGYTFSSFDAVGKETRFLTPFYWVRESLEYVIDSTQNLSFERIKREWDKHARFIQYDRDYYPSRKYAVWCRLMLINKDSMPRHYFFDAGADEPVVEAYLPKTNDSYIQVITGKNILLHNKMVPSPLNYISYTLAATDTAYIYMKFKPLMNNKYFLHNVLDAGLLFMDSNDVLGTTRTSGLWKGFIMGILIFQLLYFLLRSLLQRDVLGLYYALIILGFLLFFIYLENFGNTFYAL